MASNFNEIFMLPSTPNDLCFDKNEFMKQSFSVDEFLHFYRNAGTLETIRDDLGIYLKILRSSMIELINEDYSDFVNLSANLIDLDQSINAIESPLKNLRDEIVSVRKSLTDSMEEISECLEEKKKLHNLKKSLRNLEIVKNSLEKLKSLLNQINSASADVDQNILHERAALELIQLQFNMKYCMRFLDNQEKQLFQELENQLLFKINQHFLQILAKNDNTENLEKCLRIYYTLDQCSLAEKVFREKVVDVYMEKVITEKSLQNSPTGLAGLYNQILDFVSLKMKTLLSLTKKNGKVKGYNFLLNSFWRAIEDRIETSLTSIFAPGIPDQFYQKYKCSMEFLERIEMIIEDPEKIEEFRQTKQYKSYLGRWNLPLYFQIRFQEIAKSLEQACSSSSNLLVSKTGDNVQFQLVVLYQSINSIAKCWSNGIYIDQLFQKFFKLTLQLIARTITWLQDTVASNDSQEMDHLSFLILIYKDIEMLLLKFPQIKQLIQQRIQENQNVKELTSQNLDKCFSIPIQQLEKLSTQIESKICNEILGNCLKALKSIQDTPRLFRKTNRDIPTKHLQYVEQLLQPIQEFYEKFADKFSDAMKKKILNSIFNSLTGQYNQAVSEVLTSVQKTEESLRRLKNLRERSSSNLQTLQPSPSEKQLMSDDDKIRLQLQLDIIFFCKNIEKFQLDYNDITKLNSLIQMIEDSTKIKIELN